MKKSTAPKATSAADARAKDYLEKHTPKDDVARVMETVKAATKARAPGVSAAHLTLADTAQIDEQRRGGQSLPKPRGGSGGFGRITERFGLDAAPFQAALAADPEHGLKKRKAAAELELWGYFSEYPCNIAGVSVRTMTLQDYAALAVIGSPLLFGGTVEAEDLGNHGDAAPPHLRVPEGDRAQEMNVSCRVDTTGFTAMTQDIARRMGKPLRTVIRSEVAAVLSACVKNTPSVKLQQAINGANTAIGRKGNTYSRGLMGNVDKYRWGHFFESAKEADPRISIAGGKTYWIQNQKLYVMAGPGRWGNRSAPNGGRFSDARWAAFSTENAERLRDIELLRALAADNIRRSRGLGKQSWLQCAQDLGLASEMRGVPDYVAKALPSNGKVYKNGTGMEHTGADTFFIDILNSSPIAVSQEQGHRILQSAITGRLKFFAKNLEMGVFDELRKAARQYPGLAIT